MHHYPALAPAMTRDITAPSVCPSDDTEEIVEWYTSGDAHMVRFDEERDNNCWRCGEKPWSTDVGLCDPCLEDLRNPPEEDEKEEVLVAFAQACESIFHDYGNMLHVLHSVLTSAAESVTEFAEQASTPPKPPRSRHGSAAHCPRHGPTRGGLCRVCSRG